MGDTSIVSNVAFSPDGRMLAATGSDSQMLKIWDMSNWHELQTINLVKAYVPPVVFSPDGKLVASRSDQGITLWEMTSGHKVYASGSHAEAFAFSPDGKLLVITQDNSLLLLGVP